MSRGSTKHGPVPAVVAGAFVAAMALLSPRQVSADELITVTATLVSEGSEPGLRLALTNVSDSPVTLYEAELPWQDAKSVVIFASTSLGEPLTSGAPLTHGAPRDISIAPNERIEGVVHLVRYVPEIHATNQRDDLVVFWFYRAKRSTGELLGDFGGWQVLPRTSTAIEP